MSFQICTVNLEYFSVYIHKASALFGFEKHGRALFSLIILR